MSNLDQSTRSFLFFLLKLFLIWLSWKLFVFLVGEESTPIEEVILPSINLIWEAFNSWYREHLLEICAAALKMFGYPAWVESAYTLRIGEYRGVSVGNYCLAFQLMYYYVMLVVISDFGWRKKIIGIICGLLMVSFLNIIRLSALAVISAFYYRHSYFFHDYFFNIVVFGTLMVFYWWFGKNAR